ncbi:MAG: sialate O-acetylesterase [Janthinobacterium lividum]
MMSFYFLRQRALCISLFITLTFASLHALRADDVKPFLHPLFTDNMVLQRGLADPVWGWTTPGATVTVRIAGKGARALAGADGKWVVSLPPLPVGGPYTLTASGPQSVTLRNILVGDVWICSGQSNMDFGIGNTPTGAAEIAAADHPLIRFFSAGAPLSVEPRSQLTGKWEVCTPQSVAVGHWNGFSAVGYIFGRDLQQAVQVPIGLIQVAWGGTRVETWMSAEAVQTIPQMQPALAAFQKIALEEKNGKTFDQIMEPWYEKHDPGSAPGKAWADPALDTSAWKTISLPNFWNKAGVPELSKFEGTVWFRRTFDLPAAWRGQDLALHFGHIGERETTYVNGRKVGEANGFWEGHDCTVPNALLHPGQNVISVRDLGLGNDNGFADAPANMHIEPAGNPSAVPVSFVLISLAGPWQYQMGAPLPADDPVPPNIETDANQPTEVFSTAISPMLPFGIKGVLWYQGESSVGVGKLYQVQLTALIKDWRRHWGQGEFPFLIVQLPNTGNPPAFPGDNDTGWAELREAQLLTAERFPNSGLAIAMNSGNGDLHPPNKQDTGHRLALTAEAIVYGKKLEYSGPLYQSMTVESGAIRLHFRHVGGGLVAKGGGPLTGFAIAGADGHFVWAEAKIVGFSVVVTSPAVASPSAVRYAWADNPICNLYNQAGLPASPFRTDTSGH